MSTDSPKMRLISARVTNFGCFSDSEDVPIDDVTALIAENENGKTTFLRALAWWGDKEASFDEEDRWDGAPAEKIDLVSLTFELNRDATKALLDAGIEGPPQKLRITRDSTGTYVIRDPDSQDPLVPTRGPYRYGLALEALASRLETFGDTASASEIAANLRASQPGSGIAEKMIPRIRGEVIPALAEGDQQQLNELTSAMDQGIADPSATADPRDLRETLEPFLPRLIYFDEQVDFVKDSITYAEVKADASQHRTMINLATVAGVDLVKEADEGAHARQLHSRRSQQTLSEGFSKYWQGDPVTIFVQLDESQMTLTIEHKGRTQRPSRRSSGLKWHLGFFVNFTAEVKVDLTGAVLLLDEPGLHLHIKQQPKLLELFDDLSSDGCRIIYTTHMSSMLAPDKPHRFRLLIADRTTSNATKVVPNVMAVSSKADALQPVRQALGMNIAEAIGLGGRNVIAEGWAERYVLLAMSDFCKDTDRSHLTPATTILPAGGSGKKVLPLATMAVAEDTRVVVLVDDDRAGSNTVALLKRELPGAVPIVRTHEEGAQTGRELEDLFTPAKFVDLVNTSHADVDGYTTLELSSLDLSKPICDAIAERFTAEGLGTFQKMRVAMEVHRRRELRQLPDDATLETFANLFDRLNEALRRSAPNL